jgi:hypothetical protein
VTGVAERDVGEATHGGDLAGRCRRFSEDETDHPLDADGEVS